MATEKVKPATVDQYIATFPKEEQEVMGKIRKTIQQAVPEAEEVISYSIPAYKQNGFLIYFSAYKAHYSLSFPPPFTVFEQFKKELSPYESSKSTVQLPKSMPIPYDLIADIVKFRAKEAAENAAKAPKKKK
ncbi:iron chaperone [Chitinophaga sp. GCM10012297]|uniref:DUF1801 domain-containing protein n=1 Tax=Chitinophaga chungangae TaxID=2821488 RepID=A0ABS3YH10_9BACT|nr:DUF1801 domain-containing protein [Chitinophaga chungangae]MBO9153988.1 DUF1801 domain-containing protein [Chitinophaga chungangae]